MMKNNKGLVTFNELCKLRKKLDALLENLEKIRPYEMSPYTVQEKLDALREKGEEIYCVIEDVLHEAG
jgi:hypothetical protein